MHPGMKSTAGNAMTGPDATMSAQNPSARAASGQLPLSAAFSSPPVGRPTQRDASLSDAPKPPFHPTGIKVMAPSSVSRSRPPSHLSKPATQDPLAASDLERDLANKSGMLSFLDAVGPNGASQYSSQKEVGFNPTSQGSWPQAPAGQTVGSSGLSRGRGPDGGVAQVAVTSGDGGYRTQGAEQTHPNKRQRISDRPSAAQLNADLNLNGPGRAASVVNGVAAPGGLSHSRYAESAAAGAVNHPHGQGQSGQSGQSQSGRGQSTQEARQHQADKQSSQQDNTQQGVRSGNVGPAATGKLPKNPESRSTRSVTRGDSGVDLNASQAVNNAHASRRVTRTQHGQDAAPAANETRTRGRRSSSKPVNYSEHDDIDLIIVSDMEEEDIRKLSSIADSSDGHSSSMDNTVRNDSDSDRSLQGRSRVRVRAGPRRRLRRSGRVTQPVTRATSAAEKVASAPPVTTRNTRSRGAARASGASDPNSTDGDSWWLPQPMPSLDPNHVVARPAKQLAEALSCCKCKGLLQEAMSVPECGHSFCYDCVDEHVEVGGKNNVCPVPSCSTILGPNPIEHERLKYDFLLDALVRKVFPRPLLDKELERRRLEREAAAREMKAVLNRGKRRPQSNSRNANSGPNSLSRSPSNPPPAQVHTPLTTSTSLPNLIPSQPTTSSSPTILANPVSSTPVPTLLLNPIPSQPTTSSSPTILANSRSNHPQPSSLPNPIPSQPNTSSSPTILANPLSNRPQPLSLPNPIPSQPTTSLPATTLTSPMSSTPIPTNTTTSTHPAPPLPSRGAPSGAPLSHTPASNGPGTTLQAAPKAPSAVSRSLPPTSNMGVNTLERPSQTHPAAPLAVPPINILEVTKLQAASQAPPTASLSLSPSSNVGATILQAASQTPPTAPPSVSPNNNMGVRSHQAAAIAPPTAPLSVCPNNNMGVRSHQAAAIASPTAPLSVSPNNNIGVRSHQAAAIAPPTAPLSVSPNNNIGVRSHQAAAIAPPTATNSVSPNNNMGVRSYQAAAIAPPTAPLSVPSTNKMEATNLHTASRAPPTTPFFASPTNNMGVTTLQTAAQAPPTAPRSASSTNNVGVETLQTASKAPPTARLSASPSISPTNHVGVTILQAASQAPPTAPLSLSPNNNVAATILQAGSQAPSSAPLSASLANKTEVTTLHTASKAPPTTPFFVSPTNNMAATTLQTASQASPAAPLSIPSTINTAATILQKASQAPPTVPLSASPSIPPTNNTAATILQAAPQAPPTAPPSVSTSKQNKMEMTTLQTASQIPSKAPATVSVSDGSTNNVGVTTVQAASQPPTAAPLSIPLPPTNNKAATTFLTASQAPSEAPATVSISNGSTNNVGVTTVQPASQPPATAPLSIPLPPTNNTAATALQTASQVPSKPPLSVSTSNNVTVTTLDAARSPAPLSHTPTTDICPATLNKAVPAVADLRVHDADMAVQVPNAHAECDDLINPPTKSKCGDVTMLDVPLTPPQKPDTPAISLEEAEAQPNMMLVRLFPNFKRGASPSLPLLLLPNLRLPESTTVQELASLVAKHAEIQHELNSPLQLFCASSLLKTAQTLKQVHDELWKPANEFDDVFTIIYAVDS